MWTQKASVVYAIFVRFLYFVCTDSGVWLCYNSFVVSIDVFIHNEEIEVNFYHDVSLLIEEKETEHQVKVHDIPEGTIHDRKTKKLRSSSTSVGITPMMFCEQDYNLYGFVW